VRDVDRRVGPVGALCHGAVVLQHDDGVQLRVEPCVDVLLASHRRLGLLEVDERAVEEAGSEVGGEDPRTGLRPAGVGVEVAFLFSQYLVERLINYSQRLAY